MAATHLAQVGRHDMRSIAQQRDGAAAPRAHRPRKDAVLQQRGGVNALDQVHDARRELREALQEPASAPCCRLRRRSTPHRCRVLGPLQRRVQMMRYHKDRL